MRKRFLDLKWAQTLDGQLCDDTGSSQWISSSQELDYTHSLRAKYDGILVGAGTFLTDRAQLTVRRVKGFRGEQPLRIIIDPRNRIKKALNIKNLQDPMLKLLKAGNRPTVIIGVGKPSESLQSLTLGDSRVVFINRRIDLSLHNSQIRKEIDLALDEAEEKLTRPINSVLIEGGPTLLTSMIENQAFNRLFISVAPKVTGGKKYRVSPRRNLANSLNLQLIDVGIKGHDVVFEYQPNQATDFEESRGALQ